ncbi:MAG: hypothetical protein WCF20_05390 [Methylovirgula sp.]
MIFLHSSFRTSSTWLWTQFRSNDQVVAYYEIFNERLATITPVELMREKPENWASNHPAGPPYFLEFLPLLKEAGGVEKYDASMAFDMFIPAEGIGGALSQSESLYLASLVDHAERMGKIPLLSCTRSLGRLRAIKAAVPGFHILIYRNLFQQWCSYVDQGARGNPYFLSTIPATLEASQHDPFLKYLGTLFPLDKFTMTSRIYFYCFVLLHLYLYAQAAEAADLIIDTNLLADDAAYRQRIEDRIAEASGLAVDLSDARNAITTSFAKSVSADELLAQLTPLAELVLATVPSSKGRDFASKVLADFIQEYRRYDFKARASAEVDSHIDA